MIEDLCEKGVVTENFRITEINARFSFNGLLHQTYGHLALDDIGIGSHGLSIPFGAARVSPQAQLLFILTELVFKSSNLLVDVGPPIRAFSY